MVNTGGGYAIAIAIAGLGIYTGGIGAIIGGILSTGGLTLAKTATSRL